MSVSKYDWDRMTTEERKAWIVEKFGGSEFNLVEQGLNVDQMAQLSSEKLDHALSTTLNSTTQLIDKIMGRDSSSPRQSD